MKVIVSPILLTFILSSLFSCTEDFGDLNKNNATKSQLYKEVKRISYEDVYEKRLKLVDISESLALGMESWVSCNR